MSTLRHNEFTSYNLTDDQQRIGSILTDLQEEVLRNYLAQYAGDKLRLKLDTNNIDKFVQEEAELIGKIVFIQFLLENSTSSKEVEYTNHVNN